jgi:cyclophilin family peptidyl-prolyl cis-trans isomerase
LQACYLARGELAAAEIIARSTGNTEQMKMGSILRRLRGPLLLALAAPAVLLACAATARTARANAFVQLDFNIATTGRARDTVFIELFDDRPLTRDNFLQYVNGGHYDNTLMHRLARNFVLQGGGFHPRFQPGAPPLNTSLDPTFRVDLDNNPATALPTVPNEFGNQPPRSNVRGTIAMAKTPGNPDSATSQFFFNLSNNGGSPPDGLDFQNGGFTVFGRVVGDSMSLVDLYASLPAFNMNPDSNGDGQPDESPSLPFANVPLYIGEQSFVPLVLDRAKRIDYLGAGSTTDVPAAGYTFSERDAFIDTGAAFTGTGELAIALGRTLGIREGMQLARTLSNHGTLAPGLQLGPIGVDTYRQFLTGTLEIELRKTTGEPFHDQVVVNGTAFLSGVLDISLAPGYTPAHGDTFTVLTTGGGIVGNFVGAELPTLGDGLVWNYTRTASAIIVSVVRADYNGNGVADAADYVLWRKTLNQTGSGLAADGNGDGKVDTADYNIWRAEFGNIAGTQPASGSLAAAPVPEPSTVFVVIAALTVGVAIRRHRRI